MILRKNFAKDQLKVLTFLMFLVTIMACSHDKKPDENLQQAFKIHEDAVSLRNQIAGELEKLNAMEDSLFVATHSENLDAIAGALKNWDEQLVEVPGFEEEHDHEGHDHHHHDEQTELTSEQHLQVQQHLFDEIQKIEKSISEIKTQ
ncbi:MAG: hypothetical protein AAF519_13950 [Bacteroidota bacterium]